MPLTSWMIHNGTLEGWRRSWHSFHTFSCRWGSCFVRTSTTTRNNGIKHTWTWARSSGQAAHYKDPLWHHDWNCRKIDRCSPCCSWDQIWIFRKWSCWIWDSGNSIPKQYPLSDSDKNEDCCPNQPWALIAPVAWLEETRFNGTPPSYQMRSVDNVMPSPVETVGFSGADMSVWISFGF